MKHIVGYSILGLALIGALVLACRRQTPDGKAEPVRVAQPADWGPDGKGGFDISLVDKHKLSDGNSHVTDHPADYRGQIGQFTWTYTQQFQVSFDAANPCDLSQSTTSLTSGNSAPFTVTCKLLSTASGPYKYHIVVPPTTNGPNGTRTIGPKSCSGCVIEIQDPSDSTQN